MASESKHLVSMPEPESAEPALPIRTPKSMANAYWFSSPDCTRRITPENQPTTRAEPFTIRPSITVWSPPRQNPLPRLRAPPANSHE